MARRVGTRWVGEVPTGDMGEFKDEVTARRAEEAWWASPINTSYDQWIERHLTLVREDGYGDYPRWDSKSIGWDWIKRWSKELQRLGGWDGLSAEARDVWIRRCKQEAIFRGKIKVERATEDLVAANERRHQAQLERSRVYQASEKGKRDAVNRKARREQRVREREERERRYGLSEGVL